MTELWTFEVLELDVPAADLTGFDVEATDGHIGKIDEATYESGSGMMVVDTGFWIFGKKRMIPAGTVTDIDLDDRSVRVSLTKDQIKSAPDYDEARRDDADYRSQHTDYYGRF
jgi:hypothetical protein